MRKRRAVKRDVLPDPIYNSKVVTKVVNAIMLDGKKGTAQTILYKAFDFLLCIFFLLLYVFKAGKFLFLAFLMYRPVIQKNKNFL